MRRSKLEKYLDILKVLAHREPLKLKHVAHEANINSSVLKQHLDFLIQQKLVEEQTLSKNKVFYAITERGLKVLKVTVPIVESLKKPTPIIQL